MKVNKKQLKKMLKENNQQEVAKKLKITMYDLQVLKSKLNLIDHRKDKLFYTMSDDEFTKDYLQFKTMTLLEKYNVSHDTITNRAKRLGIYINKSLKRYRQCLK